MKARGTRVAGTTRTTADAMRARVKTPAYTKSARAMAKRFASPFLAIALVLGPLVLGPLAARAQDPSPPNPPQNTPPNVPGPAPGQAPRAPNEPSPVAPDPSLAPNDPTLDEPADPNADPVVDPNADPTADPTAPPSEPPGATPPATLPAGHEPVIHVELTPDSGMMTGDVLTLTLRVTTPARDEVTIPRGQGFAPFEVLRRPTPRVEVQGDRATHVIELELLALEPGDHELPSITLRVVTADGVVGEVQTAPLRVPVGSVLGNEPNAEPKPPTEPVEVWEDDYTLAWVLGGIGLILFGALFAWLFSRWWSRRVKAAAPPPPPRPPWEVALEKLEALRLDRDAAVREERVVGWVDQVSDALREYLGRRYEFDGLESTTDEVVTELRKRKLIGLSLDEVIALLRDCDLVKFAKAPLGVEESDLLLAGAFRVVRTTAPIAGVSAMGPVMVGMSGPSGLSGPGGLGGPGGPTPPMAPTPPSGDARWMGLPSGATPPMEPSGPSTPWVPPPGPTVSPSPQNAPTPWVPPTAPPAAPTVAPSTVSPSVVSPASPVAPAPASEPTFDPSAPWTPPGATPSKPTPKVRAEDEWMPPSARLAPTFEPRLDPAAPRASTPSASTPSASTPSASTPSASTPTPSASTPSGASSGAVIAPAPVRSAVVPTTREPGAISSSDVVAPTPVRSAVLPTTRVPETPIPQAPIPGPPIPQTPIPETPGAPSMEPAFPPTRPPAEARPIPHTMPPVAPPASPSVPERSPEPSPADSDATLPETRLRTLVGFGDPERPTSGLTPAPTDDDPSREPEDPS